MALDHTHQKRKQILDRMARIIGHMQSVKRMVENDRDCTEIIMQIVAVQKALTSCGKVILRDHVDVCIRHAVEEQDFKKIDDLFSVVDKFVH
jgi:DNA-binding FrmR family transcriptional regulator